MLLMVKTGGNNTQMFHTHHRQREWVGKAPTYVTVFFPPTRQVLKMSLSAWLGVSLNTTCLRRSSWYCVSNMMCQRFLHGTHVVSLNMTCLRCPAWRGVSLNVTSLWCHAWYGDSFNTCLRCPAWQCFTQHDVPKMPCMTRRHIQQDVPKMYCMALCFIQHDVSKEKIGERSETIWRHGVEPETLQRGYSSTDVWNSSSGPRQTQAE